MKGQMKIQNAPLKVKTAAAYNGANQNPRGPHVKEASPAEKSVKKAPKLNAEVGEKRVLVNEAKPAGRDAAIGKSTFKAPRKEGGGSVTDNGYTKVG